MPPVRDLTNSASKFATRAAAAAGDYAFGVKNPRRPWQAATSGAVETYNAAMAASLAQGSFAKGVSKSSDAEWQSAAAGKGATRFGPGAAAAKDKWQRKFSPFAAIISGITLTPRGPKGDPANLNRVAQIATALHAAKVAS